MRNTLQIVSNSGSIRSYTTNLKLCVGLFVVKCKVLVIKHCHKITEGVILVLLVCFLEQK